MYRNFSRVAGIAVGLFGLLILVGWHAHWRQFLQVLPNSAPTHYNTGIGFFLTGLGLFLLTTRRAQLAFWPAAAGASLGLLTLLQYLLGRDFGIDRLLLEPYFDTATNFPGRMSPLAAVCFIFVGTAVVAALARKSWVHRLAVTGLLGCVVAVIAGVAFFGYVFRIEAACAWGANSRMTVNSAVLFLWLGSGLLIQAWQMSRAENFNFLRWLPITVSVTLMALIAVITVVNMGELKNATLQRRQLFKVILTAQSFKENLIDMQHGVRSYLATGDTNALAAYQTGARREPQEFDELFRLTGDAPRQRQQLNELSDDVDKVLTHDQRMIDIYQQQGAAATAKADPNGLGRTAVGDARALLRTFSQEEEKLLNLGDATEEADFNNSQRLLVTSRLMVVFLLVMANYLASRELGHRKRIEVKLREISTLQNAVLNSANYAIIALDSNGVVQTFNPTAERMLQYSAAEVIGKVTPMLWRDQHEVAAEAERMSRELGRPIKPGIDILLQRSLHDGPDEYEVTYVRKDGSRFPVLVSLTVLANNTGTVTGILSVIADITERRRTEAALAELRSKHERILTSLGEGLHGIDRQGKIIFENPAAAAMLGWELAELIGQPAHRTMHHSHADGSPYPQSECHIFATMRDGVERHIEDEVFWRKDGTHFPVIYTCSAMRDEAGEILGVVVAFRDITERKKAEAALRESEERFRSAFDGAPIGIALVSTIGQWLKVNRALSKMLGYSENELLATDFQHITHPDDLKADLDYVERMLAGKISSYQMEKRYYHKRRDIVHAMLSVSLVRNVAGEPLYFVAQIENISERKLHETEREKMIEDLQSMLVQVKTLSGLIPICGWCKSVRSDQGYWQSVEQYVRARTDATFSHGMCPTCAEKFKADILSETGVFLAPAIV